MYTVTLLKTIQHLSFIYIHMYMYVHGHGLDFICTCMHIYKLIATVHMYTTDPSCMLCIKVLQYRTVQYNGAVMITLASLFCAIFRRSYLWVLLLPSVASSSLILSTTKTEVLDTIEVQCTCTCSYRFKKCLWTLYVVQRFYFIFNCTIIYLSHNNGNTTTYKWRHAIRKSQIQT